MPHMSQRLRDDTESPAHPPEPDLTSTAPDTPQPAASDRTPAPGMPGGQKGGTPGWIERHRTGLACVWLGLLLAVLGFSFQGTRGLWNTDEGRYVDNALQMVDSGNYLVPAYNADQANYTKPPLALWAIAASIRAFGPNTFAARVPSALSFMLTALLLCAMGRVLMPGKAWLPGLVYACSMAPFIAANVVSTDDMLTLCEALAMWGFILAAFTPQGRSQRIGVHVMWLGFGLAFLAKGPPGLLPLAAAAVFIVRRDGATALRRYAPWTGLVLFGVVGLAWYVAVIVRDPPLLDYFLRYELFDRIFTAAQQRNPQWYGWLVVYGPVLVLGALPWWPLLLAPLRSAMAPARWRHAWRQPGPGLFLALWFLLPLAVFCIARSRLPVYALPLFLPLALMTGRALHDRIDLASRRQWLMLGAWIALLLTIKGAVGTYMHPIHDNRFLARQLSTVAAGADFSAVAFVESTGSGVAISEHTPWGMRLYLHKPLYAIAWKRPDAAATLCRLAERHPTLLVVVDRAIGEERLLSDAAACMPHRHVDIGKWHASDVLLFDRQAMSPRPAASANRPGQPG